MPCKPVWAFFSLSLSLMIRAAWSCVRAGEESGRSGKGNSNPNVEAARTPDPLEPNPQRAVGAGQRAGQGRPRAEPGCRPLPAAGGKGTRALFLFGDVIHWNRGAK